MSILRKSRSALGLAVLVSAGLMAAPPAAARSAAARQAAAAARGLAFAQDHCASCHGLTANSSSPNPEAPPWDDVANRTGTSVRTVAAFLTDAHSYPAAMDFTIGRAAARDLAAYMITLRKPGYRPTR